MPLVNPVFKNMDVAIAGENLNRGEVIEPETGTGSLIVVKNTIDSFVPVGVVVKNALNGERVLFQYTGLGWLLPESAITATKSYIAFSSGSEAGRSDLQATVPAVGDHFREIGHVMEDGSGPGVLFRAIIHFN